MLQESYYRIFIVAVMYVRIECYVSNRTTELLSTYAKVAHWGASDSSNSQGQARSNIGQSLWTHRSDVSIRKGQNIKNQPTTYYYSMQIPTSKVDKVKEEVIPSKGEVQERFNPRPYFDFVFDEPSRQNKRPNVPKANDKQKEPPNNNPSVVYGTPVNSFPGFDTPVVPAPPSKTNFKPPTETYDSPFSSYNPPDFKPNDSGIVIDYPPNQPEVDASVPPITPPSPVYNTPLTLKPPKDIGSPNSGMKLPSDYSFRPPLALPPPSQKKPDIYYGPPPPINDEDTSYFVPPPDKESGKENLMPPQTGNEEMHGGNKNKDFPPQSSDYGPPITQTVKPPAPVEPPYLDHPPTDQDDHHQHQNSVPSNPSMAEDDLSPPPPEVPYGKIPQYLDHEPTNQDFYHFTHHDVYHEVKHTTPATTTTEAPRAGPYSYYYLGRKLWYIPLYFSVYFIVYVTILILKSIARHKIQFSHNFDKGRSSRGLDLDNINQTVVSAIDNVKYKYM